jgi:predicted phage terminase large subunit-like protein
MPGADQTIISCDLSFKDTKNADFVVMQVWTKQGVTARLVDQVRDRMDFPTTCSRLAQLAARWPAARLKLVEDKANGPAVIAQLAKSVTGMVPVNPKDSKEARAHSVAPFVEAGNVEIPDPSWAPWVGDWLEEVSSFPNAAHDDQVDAMTQALDRLLGTGRGTLRGFMELRHAEMYGRG